LRFAIATNPRIDESNKATRTLFSVTFCYSPVCGGTGAGVGALSTGANGSGCGVFFWFFSFNKKS
jgi:hypothetical protein